MSFRACLLLVPAALGASAFLAACGGMPPRRETRAPLVVRDATLIDGTGAPARPHITIVIEGRRIAAVGSAGTVEIPPSARVVDASGWFLIPGLWDMHVHLSKAKAEALPVLVANGVTSVRDMGGDIEELRAWQKAIRAGKLVGPRMKVAGPSLEAPATIERLRKDPTHERWKVTRVAVPDVESAQAAVDSVAALGVDFIKIRETVSTDVYKAIVIAAHKRGLSVAGHAPYGMDPVEAASLGVASFEHASYPYPLDPDPVKRARILDAFVRNGVVIVPTLVAWRTKLMDRDALWRLAQDDAGLLDPRRRLVSSFLAREWRFEVESTKRKSDEALREWQGFFDRQAGDLRAMHEAGVTMLPGTDLAVAPLLPGYSLHDELDNLVELVGLTPMEALESATRRPAEFFGIGDELGTIEPGKLADLVLLDADPLADISNSRAIEGVVADGRYFDAGDIRRLLGGLTPETKGTIDLFECRPGS